MNHRLASLALVVLSTTFSVSAAAATVSPAGKSFGVGFELGAPTNLNLKFMTAPDNGVVLGIGGGIWYDYSLSLHVDYLWHPLVADFGGGSFSGYIGAGGWTSLGVGGPNYSGPHYGYYAPFFDGPETIALGLRLPLGLSLAFNEVPVELFIELVPAVALFPGFGAFGQGGFGGRFYF